MPRFKAYDHGLQFLAVDLSLQLHPGSFEYALHHLIEHEIDLSEIEARYANDVVGAWAYDPRVLLKIVLLAYARGIISSRGMEAACCRDVQFMALSGNSAPHFSTLANFVSSLGPAIGKIFAQVLAICDRQGLIGRQMFAIDGVKLPSPMPPKPRAASARTLCARWPRWRRRSSRSWPSSALPMRGPARPRSKPRRSVGSSGCKREAAKIRDWLKEHPHDRKSAKGKERLSNRTDNESAKMPTDKGVVQGYTGVAAVDERHQIIVDAQAHGTGSQPRAAAAGGRGDRAPGQRTHRGVCRQRLPQRRQLEATRGQGHRGVHPRHPVNAKANRAPAREARRERNSAAVARSG